MPRFLKSVVEITVKLRKVKCSKINQQIEQLKSFVQNATKIALFCGAGISVSAGVPAFRNFNGLYKNKEKFKLAKNLFNLHSFLNAVSMSDISFIRSWLNGHLELFDICDKSIPTIFHSWICAKLMEKKVESIYNQNIDFLFEKCFSNNNLSR